MHRINCCSSQTNGNDSDKSPVIIQQDRKKVKLPVNFRLQIITLRSTAMCGSEHSNQILNEESLDSRERVCDSPSRCPEAPGGCGNQRYANPFIIAFSRGVSYFRNIFFTSVKKSPSGKILRRLSRPFVFTGYRSFLLSSVTAS